MKKNIKMFIVMLCIFSVRVVYAENLLFKSSNFVLHGANCDVFGKFADDINGAFDLFKIVAPILVVVASIFDFVKAFTGKVEGEMNKAFKKLMMRFVFAALLFFLPTILDFFLGLVNSDYSTCIN